MIYNVRQCQTSVRKMSDELQTTVKHVLNNYKTKFIILIFFANDIQCQTMSNNCQKDVRRASDNCQTSVKQLQNKFYYLQMILINLSK